MAELTVNHREVIKLLRQELVRYLTNPKIPADLDPEGDWIVELQIEALDQLAPWSAEPWDYRKMT